MGKLTGPRSRDNGVVTVTKFVDTLNHRGRDNDPNEQVGRMINISAEKQQHDAEWGGRGRNGTNTRGMPTVRYSHCKMQELRKPELQG